MVYKRAELIIAAAREPDVGKRRKVLGSATNDFLQEAERALAQITAEGVAAQAILLGEVLGELVKHDAGMPASHAQVIHVERPRTMFRPAADDSRAMRRWKRRCRWRYSIADRSHRRSRCAPSSRVTTTRLRATRSTGLWTGFRTATPSLPPRLAASSRPQSGSLSAALRITVADPDGVVASVAASRDDACGRLEALSARARGKKDSRGRGGTPTPRRLGGARASSRPLLDVQSMRHWPRVRPLRDRRRSEPRRVAARWPRHGAIQQLHLLVACTARRSASRGSAIVWTIASARALGEVVAASRRVGAARAHRAA